MKWKQQGRRLLRFGIGLLLVAVVGGTRFEGREWAFIRLGDIAVTLPPYFYTYGLREGVQGTIKIRLRYVDQSVVESEILSFDLRSRNDFVDRSPELVRSFVEKTVAVTKQWKQVGHGNLTQEVTFQLVLDNAMPPHATDYRVVRDESGNVRSVTISARPE